ncbi:3-oxoacyl-ACP reductase [Dellaglioa algida]|nr:3-oxoacyl-ACP reductase [Dellaglioa algida]
MSWAVIFGASGDIGQMIARQLADVGWSLTMHYYQNEQVITTLTDELRKNYPKQDFLPLQFDMTTSDVEAVTSQLFAVDALIFAEGTTSYHLFNEAPMADLDKMMKMQVQTPLALIQKLEPKLALNHFGRIIFIGSIYGGVGSPMEVLYSTVKGALSAFSNAYSKEVASLGITVNVVAPGAVDTKMNQQFSEETKKMISNEIPIGRFAHPEEIGFWVKQLLAKEAGYLTGQTIYVSGGWLK